MRNYIIFSSLVLAFLILPFFSIAQDDFLTVEEVRSMPNDTSKVWSWVDLSDLAMKENFDQGLMYADSAIQLAESLNFPDGLAAGKRQAGNAQYYKGNYQEAIIIYQEALEYYQKVGQELNEAKIRNNLGLIHRNKGRHDDAMVQLFKALEIRERHPEKLDDIAGTTNLIGTVYAVNADFENAEVYFNKALEGYQISGNRASEHTILLNMAGFYRDSGEPEKSIEYLDKTLIFFRENDQKAELARAYYIKGGIRYDADELVLAEQAFEEAKSIYEQLGYSSRINGCNHYLGWVALKRGQYAEAIQYAETALARSQKMGANEQSARAYRILYDIYKEKKDYKLALENYEHFAGIMDSIDSQAAFETIGKLEEKYQNELYEKEVLELQTANSKQEFALKKEAQLKWVLLVFLGLLLAIAALIYNQYRINKKNNIQLLQKNKIIASALEEKEVLLKEIHHRVKNNLQFISSLLNLQRRRTEDPNTLRVLNESKDRINSMSLVHQKLYQEDNLVGVPMKHYIDNLLDSLLHSYQINPEQIDLETNIQDLNLDIDTAIPIGLILNEVITNSLKHAFTKSKTGKLSVKLFEEVNELKLEIQDNGPGLPDNYNAENSEQFGMELVRSLASKLKAKVEMQNQSGLLVNLCITNYKTA